MIRLTFIICTYNRADFLSYCVESILALIENKEEYELIVVDNASTDNTKEVTEKYQLRYIYEEKQGLSFARNAGINNAHSEWIAFIDDDAYLNSSWLSAFNETLGHHDFDCFGGPYFPWYKDGKEAWFPDIYGSNLKWLRYNSTQEISEPFSGGNAVYKLKILRDSPMFPTELGMIGDLQGYGEETYLINWLRENKECRVGFVPKLSIEHYVPKSKQRITWFNNRFIAEGRDVARSSYKIKKKFSYAMRSIVAGVAFPLIVIDLYLRNNFTISAKVILVELMKPYLKLYGFFSHYVKIHKKIKE